MMVRAYTFGVAVIVVGGCGRLSFDPLSGGGGGGDGGGGETAALDDTSCDDRHAGALFCDGYEDPAMSAWSYSVITNGRSERTAARPYRGVASLECEIFTINDFKSARWDAAVLGDMTSGDLYVRGYYNLDSASVIVDQYSLLDVAAELTPWPGIQVHLNPGNVVVSVREGGVSDQVAYDMPRDRWVCIELHVAIDPTNGRADLTIDGSPMLSIPANTTVTGGFYALVGGVHYASPLQNAARLWVDEVIADTQPIGCD